MVRATTNVPQTATPLKTTKASAYVRKTKPILNNTALMAFKKERMAANCDACRQPVCNKRIFVALIIIVEGVEDCDCGFSIIVVEVFESLLLLF